MMKPSTLGGWIARHAGELRLAARTTLAGLITFAVGHLLALPQSYWAVLTSVIVIQASLGGSLKAGFDRLLGTFAGAVWGIAVVLAVPRGSVAALGGAFALALAPLAVVAALRPSFRIAPVTAIIMLLSTSGAQAGAVTYALDRVLEIGLGCIIGFAVSLLVLPGRAHRLLAEASAEAVRDFREMVDLLLRDLAAPADREALLAIHIRIRKAIARVEAFVDEAKHERANRLSDAPDPEPVARNLRRLRHDLTTIGRAVAEPLPTPGRQHLAEAVGHLRGSIADFLTAAADALERRRPPPPIGPIDAALTAFNDAIGDLRRSGTMAQQSADAVARTYSLAFALFQLREDLGDLADRILELADAKMQAAKTPPA